MKNLFLLFVLFFAFQNSISAQNDFGIVLGGGMYNRTNHQSSLGTKSEFTPQFKAGFSYQRNLNKSRFQLSTSLNFHYFSKVKRTYGRTSVSIGESITGGDEEDTLLSSYNFRLVSRDAHFAMSLPFVLSVNLEKFSIGLGPEFQIKTINPQVGFSYLGRLQYRLSERFSVSANYVRGLLDENRNFEGSVKTKTQRIEASIHYQLLKK